MTKSSKGKKKIEDMAADRGSSALLSESDLSPQILEQLAALEATDGESDRALAELLQLELNSQMASPERLRAHETSPQLDQQVRSTVKVPARRKLMDEVLSFLTPPALSDDLEAEREAARADRRLARRLEQFQLGRYEVRGDGNCQFRSIADQVYRSQSMHRLVRELVVRELRQRPDRYRQFVHYHYDEYCHRMAYSGTWGDHITLQAAANGLGIAIHLITSSEREDESHLVIEPADSEKPQREIWIAYVSQQHYDSIYPKEELSHRRKSAHPPCSIM